MALKIITKDGALDLEPGFSLEIEDTSPIFNERGSQSVSTTLPRTDRNNQFIGYAGRLDIKNKPIQDDHVLLSEGVYRRAGKININQYSKGYACNVGFDESELYSSWDSVSLSSLEWPKYSPAGGVSAIVEQFNDILNERVQTTHYSIFPVMVSCPENENDGVTKQYPEFLNRYTGTLSEVELVSGLRTETYLINNEEVEVTLPEGYGITPFLRASFIVDHIFEFYGYKVIDSPFFYTKNMQLARMVVLNNKADAITKGYIDYKDLLPECTINEFFQALYCRFGIVYFVDGNSKTVRLKTIKEMLNAESVNNLTDLQASTPIVKYNEPKQLRLSAATNISGPEKFSTAPAASTMDEFLKNYNYIVSTGNGYLRYDKRDGLYNLNELYHTKLQIISTDHFDWDRGANMAYEDISSVDECLMQTTQSTTDLGTYYVPCYLVGKVHLYTTIESSTVELSENQTTQTPLCFCFSYPKQETYVPFGSPRCYNPFYTYAKIGDYECNICLTFTGEDGLFIRFWREYDAMLRHANRIVEIELNLSAQQKLTMDFASPISISGQNLLFDSLRYVLPTASSSSTAVLRPLRLQEPYDLDAEQLVPVIEQAYKWVLKDNKELAVNTAIANQVAAWQANLGSSSEWIGTFMKNEESDEYVKLPFTVPTKEEYESGVEIFIKKVTYSFDLYYRYRVWSTNALGQPVSQVYEAGGVHFTVKYLLMMKAEAM